MDHLVWHFYRNRDRLKRIFNGQEELRHESLVYYYLGECHSIIERLRIFSYATSAMERELEELLKMFRGFRENARSDFSDRVLLDLREIVSEHLKWIKTFKAALAKNKQITDSWDETEIEIGLFELREWFEYAGMGMELTRERLPIDGLTKSIAEYDTMFRELVPIASRQCSERSWISQRPDTYPQMFWWRKTAWETV